MLIDELLQAAIAQRASDLHLVTGKPPAWRIDGRVVYAGTPALDEATLTHALDATMNELQRQEWLSTKRVCFSWQGRNRDLGFFRVAIYSHLGRMEATIRICNTAIPAPELIGVPAVLVEVARRPNGLILITGPTGSGKTTTLNALIGRINAVEHKKVITIEDPVEYVHGPGTSIVVQQEVGLDTADFSGALVHALRQNPDIICIGEMRDLATISTALTAAETGHLVLATLHTNSAAGTISRIVDVFPAAQQNQVRLQLAFTLQAVMCQRLLPRASAGRTLVYDLLLGNDAARNIIREGKQQQLNTVIQTHRALGMVLMDQMVRDAWVNGEITYETAASVISDVRLL